MIKVLANKPFNLRPWEIGKLTPYQISVIYLAKRDEQGQILLTEPISKLVPNSKDLFWTWGELKKLKSYQIEKLWIEHVAKSKR